MTRTQPSRRRTTSRLLLLAGLTIGICTAALTDHSPTQNPAAAVVVMPTCEQAAHQGITAAGQPATRSPQADTSADDDDQNDATTRAPDYTTGSGCGAHPQWWQQPHTDHTAPPSRRTQPPSPPPG